MARLFADENLPLPVVLELRARGHDVLTVLETGKSDQAWPDDEVLAFAARENRTLLTLNRKDFIHLHKSAPRHAGIIVCTFDRNFSEQVNRIHQEITALDDLAGKLIRVNRPPG